MNAYFSISLFTGNRRRKEDFRSFHAIVLDDAGAIVRSAATAPAGSDIKLMFAEDAVKARVTQSPAK